MRYCEIRRIIGDTGTNVFFDPDYILMKRIMALSNVEAGYTEIVWIQCYLDKTSYKASNSFNVAQCKKHDTLDIE